MPEDFGFFILRHINSEQTNKYWIKSYECIRKYYTNKIIIIDSKSDPQFLKSPDNLINCEVIDSEFPGAGELSCYYYFYKYHYFEKAVIIHDSMFIQHPIDFTNFTDVLFLWNINSTYCLKDHYDEQNAIINTFTIMQNNEELLQNFTEFRLSYDWQMCFGTCCMIEHSFITELENEYGCFDMLKHPELFQKFYRCAMERVFALLCCYKKRELIQKPSLFGCMFEYLKKYNIQWWECNYDYAFCSVTNERIKEMPIIKFWSGR